jgi:LmbE family N-acetylglucosaminyl deacetylase
LIHSLNPYAVFIPDPFFPIGNHQDHINTGKSSYLALKSLKPEDRPKIMLMYQSFKPNRSVEWADPRVTYMARMSHRSQWPEIEMRLLSKIEKIFMRSKKYRFENVEPYRKFSFESSEHQLHNYREKFLWHLISRIIKPGSPGSSRFKPTPEELKRLGQL